MPSKKRVPKAVRDYLRKIGKSGATKGGHVRRNKLTAERRREIARAAAAARWMRRKSERE